jgi:hypothetical protein
MHRSYPCFLPPTQNRDMKINGSGEKLTLHTLKKKHPWSSSLILFPPANFHITFIIICGYHGKGKWISKGLFAVFVCTKNERKYFSFLPWRKNTFMGSAPLENIFFFLKSDLKWAFSDILIHFQCSNLIFVKLLLYCDIIRLYWTNQFISGQKYKNIFVHFWCKWNKAKSPFEIIWPLGAITLGQNVIRRL